MSFSGSIAVGEQISLGGGGGHDESARIFKTNISKCKACSLKKAFTKIPFFSYRRISVIFKKRSLPKFTANFKK